MIKKVIDYIGFSGMTAGIGFLTVMYMTKNMTVEEFGIVGLFMAALYILPQLISFSSIGLVSINKVKLENKEFILFSKSYFTFGMVIFIIVFLISLIGGIYFNDYLILFILIPLIALIQYLSLFHNTELIQDGKSKRFGTYRLMLAIISFAFTVLALSYFHLSWDGRLYAILLSEFIKEDFEWRYLRGDIYG
jgi:O-antigen/teichoic acid export membrane protein